MRGDRSRSMPRPRSSATRVSAAATPPASVTLSPTIAFWTPFAISSTSTKSSIDSWPTSRLPATRSSTRIAR
ncbi:MAG: hypothetical protein A2V85_17585 [Chloroflexi bacterium RBG_16_72_14]|nr:MAG: hypothetical protein A2V85_17585 [Chloroflexi bacterium RBG_16_72_14]